MIPTPNIPRASEIAVIIPALDEEDSLPSVLDALPDGIRVVVVDNGSTDRTADIAIDHGAVLIREPNRGYGNAVQAGLRYLKQRPPTIVVILDADLADDPQLMYRLVDPIFAGTVDIVLADRTCTAGPGALTIPQRFGNRLATTLMYLSRGIQYRDMGPFRALSWSAVQRMDLQDPTWGWNVEIQLKAANRRLRVIEIPMPYRPRARGRSKISGSVVGSVRAGVRILQAVYRYQHS